MKAGDRVVCINPDSRQLVMLKVYTVKLVEPLKDGWYLLNLTEVKIGQWVSTRFILLPEDHEERR